MARRFAFMAACLCATLGLAQPPDGPSAFWEEAAVYRDEWGTPHVYATNFRALAFAFGYAQADDHLEPMLAAYRVANGRAAEVFGRYFAESDEFALKMGHGMLARSAFPGLDPLTQDVCEGFALGVNAWLVEHPDRVPPWADGVKPEDVLALLHCYLMSMAPFDLPEHYHRQPAAFSGNAWAVGPPRSESGKPILAINPHAYYEGPFLWYEAHLACQDLNVAGGTLFGLPVILMGHNEVLGWALTPNQPDFADIYLEPALAVKRDPKSVMGAPMIPANKLIEMMVLANSRPYYVDTPDGLEQRMAPCLDTVRGPIVGNAMGRMCSYRVGGYHDFGVLFQLMEMARARDLASFQGALALQQLPCFHVVYADRSGNILYLYNTIAGEKAASEKPLEPEDEGEFFPPRPIDWREPHPADNPLFAWGGVVPVEALPSVLNPESGYLQACGTPPWGVTDDAGISPEDLPPWLVLDRDSFRARRVRQLLGMGKRSFRDCQSMLYDVVVPFAMEIVPRLLDAAAGHEGLVANSHPDLAVGLDVLGSWNCVAETGSTGMTFFHAWWSALQAQTSHMFESEEEFYGALWENPPEVQIMSLNAAAEAARMMRNEYQSLTVPWGDVHTVTRGGREVGVPGAASGEPIFMASDHVYDKRKWRVTYGCGFAMVVEFGERPKAVSVLPFGTSENPESPHYADQLDLMIERRFKVTRFEHEDVQRYATSAKGQLLYLRPKGMEAVFTLHAAAPVEARLNASTEPPEELPRGTVPFTLFVEMEKAPRETPMTTYMAIYVPPVLCARQTLEHLAVYAYDSYNKWRPLETQQLDIETRTFTAQDDQSPRIYAVLGPAQYRAARVIPGKDALEPGSEFLTGGPVVPKPEFEGEEPPRPPELPTPPLLEPPSGAPEPLEELEGVPPRQHSIPIGLPPEAAEPKPLELPKLDVTLPQAQPKSTKKAPLPETRGKVRRNFNLKPPGQTTK